ncbi:MAG: hypothetical protein OWU84_07380 [Firmicutes bacterium]|nr:hypothetical protein [Bacillota bacterium]
MSSAETRYRGDKPQGGHDDGRTNGRAFRRVLGISALLGALGLWQLNPLIRGLQALDRALIRVKPFRQHVIYWLSLGYHRAHTLIGPWVRHWHL